MRETDRGTLGQVLIDLLPGAVLVLNAVAPGAQRQKPAQALELETSVAQLDAASYKAQKFAAGAGYRSPGIQDPAILAIVAAQAIGHLEGTPRIEVDVPGLQAAGTVVGVYAIGPAIALLLGERAAAEPEPALVEIVTATGGVSAPDHDRR